jgi:hypothetical protein
MIGVQLAAIFFEALCEIGNPLGIDKRLDDAADLVLVVLPSQGTQKSEVDDFVDIGINPIDQLGLIGAVRDE